MQKQEIKINLINKCDICGNSKIEFITIYNILLQNHKLKINLYCDICKKYSIQYFNIIKENKYNE